LAVLRGETLASFAVCDPDVVAPVFCVVGQEFIENPSENFTLTRSGDLRTFRIQPVGGAVLALPAPR
jgi:hypothetical protein